MIRARMKARTDAMWVAGLFAGVAALLMYTLDLRSFSFSAPFHYGSDSLQYMMVFRTVLETGWYTHTDMLGAPFGATHYDAPVPDAFFLAIASAMRLFTDSPAVVFNVFLIGGFFATTWAFFAAARMLDVPRPLAAIGALAYTWLPFHFLRTGHLFYTIYFVPPLVVAVAAKLADERLDPLRAWLTWPRVLLFIVTGTAGIYNAFFSIVVLCFAALAAAVAWRDKRRLAHGITAAAIVAVAALATLAPSVIYQARHGKPSDVSQRFAGESETYALKLVQLVVPNINHPIGWMRAPAGKYHSSGASITENYTASLALLGSAGFILSLVLLFGRFESPITASGRRLDLLSKSNALLFLFATVGGLGATFAVLVSPQLRAWNRLSLMIAAVSLLVLLIALSRWAERASNPSLAQRRVTVVTAVLAVVWLFDEAGWRMSQPAAARVEFRSDADFVAKAAALVPPGAMVYELPYVGYPEVKPLHAEDYYGMGRPYIHPSSLKWSYGAMRGRESDKWLRELSTRPIDEQLDAAAKAGFAAVYVERRGYADHGAQVEARLRAQLGAPLVERADGETAFYLVQPRK